LLCETCPDIELYYNKDEIVMFDNIDELVEKINHLEENPKEAQDLFYRSNKALWNKNTALHEWDKVLPKMDDEYKKADIDSIIKENYNQFIYTR